MERCPLCQGVLYKSQTFEGLECESCHRVWVKGPEGWESLPQQVSVDQSQLKEGVKYTDIVKPLPSLTNFRHRLDVFIHSVPFIKPSREVSLAHTHLQRAFMWLGKAQGATGSESPYKESFNHKTPTIESTADQTGSNLFLQLWKDNDEYGTHTARVKSLRANIADHLKDFTPFSKAPNQYNDDYLEYLKQSRLAAQEASMWLGWELANIKKQKEWAESGQPMGTAPHPASNLPL